MIETIKGSCEKLVSNRAYNNRFITGAAINGHELQIPSNLSEDADGYFYGAIMPSSGPNVIFIPKNHPHIGIYNCANDSYTNGPLHGGGPAAFHKGVDLENGTILMCPYNTSNIGLYNYVNNSYSNGPSITSVPRSHTTIGRFIDCIKIGQKVYLIPASADNIVVYDIQNNTIQLSASITINYGDKKFSSAVQISDTEILLIPYSNYYFYRYNFVTGTISQDIATNRVLDYFGPSIRLSNKVICSANNGGFLVYDISEQTLANYVGEKSYSYNNPFSDLILHGKHIVCVPKRSLYVGEYEYGTNTYARGNLGDTILSNDYINFYAGGCSVANRIIMAPCHAANVGIYKPESNIA